MIGRLIISDSSLTVDDIIGKSSAPKSSFQYPTRQHTLKTTADQTKNSKGLQENKLLQIQDLSQLPEKLRKDDSRKTSSAPISTSTVAQSSTTISKEILDNVIDQIQVLPRFDWIQKLDIISIIFYTKPFSNPLIEIYPPKSNKAVTIILTYEEYIFQVSVFLYIFH